MQLSLARKDETRPFFSKGKTLKFIVLSWLTHLVWQLLTSLLTKKQKYKRKDLVASPNVVSSPNVLRKEVFKSFLFLTLLIKRMIDGVKTMYHPSVIKLLPPIRLLITTR